VVLDFDVEQYGFFLKVLSAKLFEEKETQIVPEKGIERHQGARHLGPDRRAFQKLEA
jgi:hypothetical protein